MSDPRFRIRVERLLRGEFRADDIKTLFLYARDRCGGRQSVEEIGNFTAHHDERSKGIVTQSTRDWFTNARFMAPRFLPDAAALNPQSLPVNTPEHLYAALRRKSSGPFKQKSGKSLVSAKKILDGFVKKLKLNSEGTYRVSDTISSDEENIFNALCSSLDATYVFTEEGLLSDFREILRSSGILLRSEFEAFNDIRQALSLFSIACMHNNDIIMDDKTRIRLQANLSKFDNLIQIFAEIPTGIKIQNAEVNISAPIFGINVNINSACSEYLISTQEWKFELELRDDMRLHAII